MGEHVAPAALPLPMAPPGVLAAHALFGPVCLPHTHEPLVLAEGKLFGAHSHTPVPIQNGIPTFMDPAALSIQDRKIMEMFNRAAPWFDMMERTLGRIFFHRFLDVRREAMGLLDAQPGMAVLEVGIGTGSNMRYMPKGTQCFGTDFCPGMLMRCSRNMARQSLHVPLTRSLASALPYADRAFDVVFHVGAFNFLSDKAGTLGRDDPRGQARRPELWWWMKPTIAPSTTTPSATTLQRDTPINRWLELLLCPLALCPAASQM